ncbi:chemerin-like receptor 1 [Heterodontus francisci]|uniref:chemerin-like receptor 1 n=1 Tax=Heterodontus francisci TaxID=7792 RepID=UPI00355ACDD3
MEAKDLQLGNGSDSPSDVVENEGGHSSQRAMDIFIMVIYLVTFAMGVLGNGLVIWATAFKLKKTVNTIWFLGLAIADFTFALFLPLSATYISLDFHWPFGTLLCKLNSGVGVLTMFASVLTLAAISVDRCVSVVLPVWAQNHRGPRLANLVTVGVWLVSAILSGPTFVYRETGSHGNSTVCFSNYFTEAELAALNGLDDGGGDFEAALERMMSRFRLLVLTRFLCGFLLPLLVISASYVIIGLRLWRNRLAPSSKPFRVMVAIILTFLLCWAPYHIFIILELMHPADQPPTLALRLGIPLSTSLASFNSCLNPFLYICMGKDFRDKVKRPLQKVLENAFVEESVHSYTFSRGKTRSSLVGDEASMSV